MIYVVNAMSQSKTLLWYKHFKNGRTSVDDDERSDERRQAQHRKTLQNFATLSLQIVGKLSTMFVR